MQMESQKKKEVAKLTSDKISFRSKMVTRDKDGHYMMIRGSIHWDDTIINIYALNIRNLKYMLSKYYQI